MAEKIKGITIEIGGNVTPLNKALKDVNSNAKGLQNELGLVNKALKLDTSNTELVKQKQVLLKEAVKNTKDKLETLKEAQKQADRQMQDGIEVDQEQYRKLQREIAFTEGKLQSYESELKSVKLSLEDVGKAIGKVGKTSQDMGKKLLPVTGGIVALGVGSAKMATTFDESMAKVSTIADTTSVSMDDLKSTIMDLSNETGISASDIAENVYNAISAGQKTGDAVNFVSNATKLAKAGFAETGNALDILTTILNAYGLEAKEVTNVSDLLIQTQNLGKTTVAELSTSMGKVIPTAKANAISLDQVCASYAIMTANGIATAETTTYLNSMLNELGKGGTGVDLILREKTGKSFKQLSEDGFTLSDVLGILNETAISSNRSFGDLWSSSEAGKAATILLGDSVEDFNGTLKDINSLAGATDSAFQKMDTQANQNTITINQLKNTLIELGGTILNMVAPMIQSLSEKVRALASWFNGLSQSQKKTIVVIGAIIGAIGPALIIFVGISSIISVMIKLKPIIVMCKTAFASFNAVLMANPITLIIGACVGLIAILVNLYKKCDWFREGVNEVWSTMKTVFLETWETIRDFFTITIPESIGTLVTSINEFFVGGWNTIVSFFTESIPKFIETVLKWLKKLPQNIGLMISEILGNITKFGQDIWRWITTEIPKFISKTIDNIKQLPSKVWEWLSKTLGKVGEFCVSMVAKGIEVGTDFLASVIDIVKKLPSEVWSWFKKTAKKVVSFGKDLAKKGKKAGGELFDAIIDAVIGLPDRMKEIGGDIVRGVWSGITSMGTWLKDKVGGFFGGIVGGVKDVLGIHSPSRVMAKEVGQHMPTGVAMGIEQTEDVVTDSIEHMVGNSVNSARTILDKFSRIGGFNMDYIIGNRSMDTQTTSNHYGQNHIEIHCNKLDRDNINEICDEINYRLGMAF